MNIIRPFFAQILPSDVLPSSGTHWMGLTLKELFTLLGAVSIVTLLVFIWAAYIRKRPSGRSHHHHHHSHSSSAGPPESSDAAANGEKRFRRKRRRRREHRPRNPTLAETGGLPPVRTEHPPEPLP